MDGKNKPPQATEFKRQLVPLCASGRRIVDFAKEFGSSCAFATVALDVQLEDCRVMHEPIDRGHRHSRIGKNRSIRHQRD